MQSKRELFHFYHRNYLGQPFFKILWQVAEHPVELNFLTYPTVHACLYHPYSYQFIISTWVDLFNLSTLSTFISKLLFSLKRLNWRLVAMFVVGLIPERFSSNRGVGVLWSYNNWFSPFQPFTGLPRWSQGHSVALKAEIRKSLVFWPFLTP